MWGQSRNRGWWQPSEKEKDWNTRWSYHKNSSRATVAVGSFMSIFWLSQVGMHHVSFQTHVASVAHSSACFENEWRHRDTLIIQKQSINKYETTKQIQNNKATEIHHDLIMSNSLINLTSIQDMNDPYVARETDIPHDDYNMYALIGEKVINHRQKHTCPHLANRGSASRQR